MAEPLRALLHHPAADVSWCLACRPGIGNIVEAVLMGACCLPPISSALAGCAWTLSD
jgi:hypothetical protein